MRLIDADALLVSENECQQKEDCRTCRMFLRGCEDFAAVIEDAPTIEERKTGRWIWRRFNIECSECGGMPYFDSTEPLYKFCPFCGADMRGGK